MEIKRRFVWLITIMMLMAEGFLLMRIIRENGIFARRTQRRVRKFFNHVVTQSLAQSCTGFKN